MDFKSDCSIRDACYGRCNDMINKVIELGKYKWNTVLYYACDTGNLDIAKLMIEKGANDFDNALHRLCCNKYGDSDDRFEIAKLLISKPVTEFGFGTGFGFACMSCHIDIVKLLMEKGINTWNYGVNEWNSGLTRACMCERFNVVKLMIEKGANKCVCGKSMAEHLVKCAPILLPWKDIWHYVSKN